MTGVQAMGQEEDFDPGKFIEWNEFYQLSWDNFNGKPTGESIGDAGTAVKIQAKPYIVDNKIYYNVYALFDRQKSWVMETSPALLAHEQLHFDIAELYARKVRKKVAELSANNEKDLKMYNKTINKILKESNRADRQYDMETLHGGLTKQQEKWRAKVEFEMKKLHKYKKPVKRIGVN